MKTTIISLLFLFNFTISFAQHHQRNEGVRFSPQQYKQELETFVKQKANLTDEEAKEVMPVIHEMMSKQRELKRQEFSLTRNLRKESATDADYEKALRQQVDLAIEDKNIEKQYMLKLSKYISWHKIMKVRFGLQQFNFEAIKKFQPNGPRRDGNRRGDNRNNANKQ